MKLIKFFALALTILTFLFTSCSDNETAVKTIKEKFTFDNKTVTLENAKLYLTYEEDSDIVPITVRKYLITDGTRNETTGGLEGRTYSITIYFVWPTEEGMGSGEYPLFDSFGASEPHRMSWIELNSEGDVEYYNYQTPANVVNGSPIIISGGFEDEDTMTLTFTGTLTSTDEDWVEKPVSGTFHFEGEVQDIRPQ